MAEPVSVRAIEGALRPPKLRTVVVTSEDGPALDEALLAALRELFARVGIALVESDEGKDEGLLARVRIQRDVDAATVRVFSVTNKRLASTHRVPRGETEALFRETLAHVVLGAVEPLVVERVELEAKLPEPSAPMLEATGPSEPASPRVRLPLHFGAGLGAGPLVLGDLWGTRIFGRADVYVATRVPSVFGVTLGGILPRHRTRASADSELGLSFARVQAGVEPWLSRIVRLGVLLSLGADLISVTTHPRRAADHVASPARRVDALLGALVQLRFPLWRGLELQTIVGCDLDLTPRTFVARDDMRSIKLFAPARARPYAGLLVAWSSL